MSSFDKWQDEYDNVGPYDYIKDDCDTDCDYDVFEGELEEDNEGPNE